MFLVFFHLNYVDYKENIINYYPICRFIKRTYPNASNTPGIMKNEEKRDRLLNVPVKKLMGDGGGRCYEQGKGK